MNIRAMVGKQGGGSALPNCFHRCNRIIMNEILRISSMRSKLNLPLSALIVLILVCLPGCSDIGTDAVDAYLVRVGDQIVSVIDFNKAFEIAKTAYPHNIIQNPDDYKEAQIRLLNQMTEELILLERARELEIRVTEEELESAIAKIKEDYPDEETFEQTLLEYAVSYQSWRKGLKTRLLMDKLVERELKNRIVITPEEIAKYYKEHYSREQVGPEPGESPQQIDTMIIDQLRREKTEAAYKSWIDNLQKRYAIEINKKEWEKILSS